MAGSAKPNIVTSFNSDTDSGARIAERGSGTPFVDIPGDGSYNSYLGCNRAGSCAPGIGINTGDVLLTAAQIGAGQTREESWTELDQDGDARIPQDSQHIGGTGFVDRSTTSWPSSGGNEGKGTEPVTHVIQPASVPGTVDVNDTANLVITDTAAADGAVMDTSSGAVNQTGSTVGVGDLVWGNVPVV